MQHFVIWCSERLQAYELAYDQELYTVLSSSIRYAGTSEKLFGGEDQYMSVLIFPSSRDSSVAKAPHSKFVASSATSKLRNESINTSIKATTCFFPTPAKVSNLDLCLRSGVYAFQTSQLPTREGYNSRQLFAFE